MSESEGIGMRQTRAYSERTSEECERIKYVAQDELQSQLVNTEAVADPGEQAIDSPDECQDCNHIAENLPSNIETKKGTLAKGLQCVHGRVLGIIAKINNNSSTRHRLLQLWYADLAYRHRRRNTHHRGGNKVLSWDTQAYVQAQESTSDRGEPLNGSTPMPLQSQKGSPEVMIRWISDSVITSMKGLTKHADSP